MDYAKYVKHDEQRKRAIYLLGTIRLKGFVTEHGTAGLYWFNTEERMNDDLRDLLVGADEVKVLVTQ